MYKDQECNYKMLQNVLPKSIGNAGIQRPTRSNWLMNSVMMWEDVRWCDVMWDDVRWCDVIQGDLIH